MSKRTGIVCIAIALSAATTAARAQGPTHDSLASSPGAAAVRIGEPGLGPTVEGGIAGMHRAASAPSFGAPPAASDGPHVGRDAALMIAGGAGVIVGAIIGGTAGTLFMVGGAIAGLYGLYEYLQ